MDECFTTISKQFDARFASEDGFYGKWENIPIVGQRGHARRMQLLQSLDIGDVSSMTCLDFGVGSWGFACVYPKLHGCRLAYGMDISQTAVEISTRVSSEKAYPYGQNFLYLQSDGMNLPLPDASVDLVFSGESIEHVLLPHRFLAECYRVLRPSGQLIITTPNRNALLYKTQGEDYCVSPEHFWLFNYQELHQTVSIFFDVVEAYGFNGALYNDMDQAAVSPEACEVWANLFLHQPELGTGMVLRATRKPSGIPMRFSTQPVPAQAIQIEGPSELLALEFGLSGCMIVDPTACLRFECPPCEKLLLYFWSHDWSGVGHVLCGDREYTIDLWSRHAGWKPLVCEGDPIRPLPVVIAASGEKDPRAMSSQVIFHRALTFNVSR